MTNEGQNDAGPATSQAGKRADPRARIIDALMRLAAERAFEDIAIRDICAAAGVTLADFRDAFPSKGAVLGGFSKRIDRAVLSHGAAELASEAPRERLFDVLMRRLDAMAPYRGGLREIAAWLRRDPTAALALNRHTGGGSPSTTQSTGSGPVADTVTGFKSVDALNDPSAVLPAGKCQFNASFWIVMERP